MKLTKLEIGNPHLGPLDLLKIYKELGVDENNTVTLNIQRMDQLVELINKAIDEKISFAPLLSSEASDRGFAFGWSLGLGRKNNYFGYLVNVHRIEK